jgi:dethiobiotin synthetase
VAKEGALAALAASKPGVGARERDYELEAAKAEVARLGEALKEMAVKLTLVEGKGGWAVCPERNVRRCRRSSARTVLCR